jgi:hypothetical protein
VTTFEIASFQNEFLPEGGRVMNAVVTVTASGVETSPAAVGGPLDRAEVIVVDVSGSMGGKKIRSAKEATKAAIDCLPDGVKFGVVLGNHHAVLAYPKGSALAVASDATRHAATNALKKVSAGGGTAIGGWISLTTSLLRDEPGLRHAILLTDGKNESEDPGVLEAALSRAEGIFQCDCRGVGADWQVADLRSVATTLLGTYDIVADPEDLSVDFSSMMQDSMHKQVAEVTLRVWAPQNAEIAVVKQMEPIMNDLTESRQDVGPLTGGYRTGSWGNESRDYYISVRLPEGKVDDEMLAARVTLMVGDEAMGQALIKAVWTEDSAKSTRINRQVAEAMGETELADAIQEGVDALRGGDTDTATNRFGKAVRLATETGNDEAMARLATLVEVDDAPTGRVRPKAKVDEMDVMIVETKSTRTVRTRK